MEIFGGFMVMMSIISLFLAVVWLVMPFVVFAIKGKQDRTLEVLEGIDRRLADLEARLQPAEPERNAAGPTGFRDTSAESSYAHPIGNTAAPCESSAKKNGPVASSAV